MSNESAPILESHPTIETTPESKTLAWVSALSIIACIGIFFGLSSQNEIDSFETLSRFGYLPAGAIWQGGYWALFTSAFVHLEAWHLIFNVYWLWVLGNRLERAIGSLPFLAFFIVSAGLSSSFQLAVSDDTGIGASGVVFAFFGFMWPTRSRYPEFNEVLDARTIRLILVWLVGCVVVTYLEVFEVGNAAHVSGLLFGVTVAGAFVLRFKPRVMVAGLVAMVVLSMIPLFWCPWSVTWLSEKAYDAHVSKQYNVALNHYTNIIQIDPENAWAYGNRSAVYLAIGKAELAEIDLQKALEIDPSMGEDEEDLQE